MSVCVSELPLTFPILLVFLFASLSGAIPGSRLASVGAPTTQRQSSYPSSGGCLKPPNWRYSV